MITPFEHIIDLALDFADAPFEPKAKVLQNALIGMGRVEFCAYGPSEAGCESYGALYDAMLLAVCGGSIHSRRMMALGLQAMLRAPIIRQAREKVDRSQISGGLSSQSKNAGTGQAGEVPQVRLPYKD